MLGRDSNIVNRRLLAAVGNSDDSQTGNWTGRKAQRAFHSRIAYMYGAVLYFGGRRRSCLLNYVPRSFRAQNLEKSLG
jgi:hypothetical protein